ncbi:hypothetical protein DM01DRAFT_1197151 [Hesseltinella vesiculosa]|uniref:Uncharacterized protein n=1 Tax=Hesseltinella vesiculosa TaxID=101127 RepID=A0A1X2G3E6_9FUNG|nr:hypothetical protein DM01DRAFT_1197151 [Hesseltinella vesiculosa]
MPQQKRLRQELRNTATEHQTLQQHLQRKNLETLTKRSKGARKSERDKYRDALTANHITVGTQRTLSPELPSIDFSKLSLKKITGIRTLQTCVDELQALNTTTPKELAVKTAVLHVLSLFLHTPHMMKASYVTKCSETSLIVKYWDPLLEAFFWLEQ